MTNEWDHTASILCMLVNMVSKKKVVIEDFHPFLDKKKAKKKKGMSIKEFVLKYGKNPNNERR